MANIYVRSTDGSDADNGSTWALAKATIAGAAGIDAAGDVVYVSSSHNESPATAQIWAWAGTLASPVRILSVDDSAEPPTTYSAGAQVSCQDNLTIANTGAVTIAGLELKCGFGVSTSKNMTMSPGVGVTIFLRDCVLRCETTNVTSIIQVGGNNGYVEWEDVDVKMNGTAHRIDVSSGNFIWNGGALLSGSITASTFFGAVAVGSTVRISGLDLSNASSSVNLFNSTNRQVSVICRNIRLPASWSGSFYSGTPGVGSRFEFYNCDVGDTNYRLHVADYFGTIVSETTVVRSGGASDGVTPLAWKLVSSSTVAYRYYALSTPEIVADVTSTGSSLTATVEIITDNVTLTDAECWLEIQYLGTSGYPLSSFASDAKSDLIGSASNQATSTETWTTTGLTTPVKQKLSVTFTPQEAGFVHAVVKLAKPSTTVYVDPKLTIA